MTSKSNYYGAETSQRWMVSYVDVLTILLILFVALAAQSLHSHPLAKPAAPLPAKAVPQRLVIGLSPEILFRSGQDQLGPAGLAAVAQVAELLRGIPNRVTIVGHSDTRPIHTPRFKSNWDLSAARSLKLLDLLANKHGIAASRLSITGCGSTRPRDTNDTGDGRAANRRVEIVILDEAAR